MPTHEELTARLKAAIHKTPWGTDEIHTVSSHWDDMAKTTAQKDAVKKLKAAQTTTEIGLCMVTLDRLFGPRCTPDGQPIRW
jgi:hypothetical protein